MIPVYSELYCLVEAAAVETLEAGCKHSPPLSTLHRMVPDSLAFAPATGNTFVLVKIYSLYSRRSKVWDVEEAQSHALVTCFLSQAFIPFPQN